MTQSEKELEPLTKTLRLNPCSKRFTSLKKTRLDQHAARRLPAQAVAEEIERHLTDVHKIDK